MTSTRQSLYAVVAAVLLLGVPVHPDLFDGINESDAFTIGDDFGAPDIDMDSLLEHVGNIEMEDFGSKLDLTPLPHADIWDKINSLKKRLGKLESIAVTIQTNITASREAVNSYTPPAQSAAAQTVDLSAYATKTKVSNLHTSIATHTSSVKKMISSWDAVSGESTAVQSRIGDMSEKFDYLSKEIKQAEEKATNLINAVAKSKCPEGWTELGGHCYAYFRMSTTWQHAAAVCLGHSATLLQLETDEESSLVKDIDPSHSSIWGGATNAFDVYRWAWLRGNATLESNTLYGSSVYFLSYHFNWAKYEFVSSSSYESYPFICEKW